MMTFKYFFFGTDFLPFFFPPRYETIVRHVTTRRRIGGRTDGPLVIRANRDESVTPSPPDPLSRTPSNNAARAPAGPPQRCSVLLRGVGFTNRFAAATRDRVRQEGRMLARSFVPYIPEWR